MTYRERVHLSSEDQATAPRLPEAGGAGSSGEMLKRVARGGIVAFFVYGLGIGITYGAQLVIARTLGVESYGTYAYTYAWVVILAYAATIGFDVALLRIIPTYQARGDLSLMAGAMRSAQRWSIGAGVAIAVVGACIALNSNWSPELRWSFIIGFLTVPIMALVRVRCAIVRAFGGVASALLPDRVVRDGLVITLLLIFSFGLGWRIDARLVLVVTLIGAIVSLAVTFPAIERYSAAGPARSVGPSYDSPAWIQYALPLVMIGAAEALMNRTGILVLGWLGDTKGAGIYGLAFNISLVVTLPRIALNTLFAPEVSALHARKAKGMLQLLVTRSASWTLIACAGVAIVLYVFAEPLFDWFGPGYRDGVPALRILLIGQAIAASAGSQLYVMTMTGREKSAAVLLIVCAVANALASFVLIGLFGLVGAAVASASSLVIWNVAMAVFLWRELDLRPGVLAMLSRRTASHTPAE